MQSLVRRTAFQELSYGVPVEVIARWLGVSVAVASKYKNGLHFPRAAELELFKLKLEGRIVPDEWDGFSFRGTQLFGPDGKAFSHGHLRAYELGMQLMREFARGNPQRMHQINRIYTRAGLTTLARTQNGIRKRNEP